MCWPPGLRCLSVEKLLSDGVGAVSIAASRLLEKRLAPVPMLCSLARPGPELSACSEIVRSWETSEWLGGGDRGRLFLGRQRGAFRRRFDLRIRVTAPAREGRKEGAKHIKT